MFSLAAILVAAAISAPQASPPPAPATPAATASTGAGAGGPFEPVAPDGVASVVVEAPPPPRWSPSIDPALERRYGRRAYAPLNRIVLPF
ncbi:MAG TPA: hypothetical protein VN231_08065 [Allosphingosinicella sp.]|nr:hypothetical protein [Allosphingosinicella sp.]